MPARTTAALTVALLAAVAAGCAAALDEPFETSLDLSAADTARLLDLVNYPGTDLETLDVAVALDRRAAEGIVAHRAGADGVAPSSDDDRFDTLAELDDVPYVGAAALGALLAYAVANPPPAGELVDGIAFSGWESMAVVWGVNQASAAELAEVGVNSRGATNLVALAPYGSVADMTAVPFVGPVAVEKLHDHAAVWWTAMQSGETVPATIVLDGVAFDATTAAVALEIANGATHDQLTGPGGMWTTGADRIIDARPHATLAGVAGTSGVGTVTMQALHDYAASGLWAAAPPVPAPTAPPAPTPAPPPATPPWIYPAVATTPSTCAVELSEIALAAVSAYSSELGTYDVRDESMRYAVAAFQAPACLDLARLDHFEALQDFVLDRFGWGFLRDYPGEGGEMGVLTPGPIVFRSLLDDSLAVMDAARVARIAAGEADAQSLYDALAADEADIVARLGLHPGTTYSFEINAETGGACNERSALVIDLTDGTVILMHAGPAC